MPESGAQQSLHSLLRTTRQNRFARKSLRGKGPLRRVAEEERNGNSANCTTLQRDQDACQREEALSSFCSEDNSEYSLFLIASVRIYVTENADAAECSFGTGDSACSARNIAFCLYGLFDLRGDLRLKENQIRSRVQDTMWTDCLFWTTDCCYRMDTLIK